MNKLYKRSLVRFRQDLRVDDNTALFQAVQHSDKIFPVFFFDPTILSTFPKYDKRLTFIVNALKKLDQTLSTLGGGCHVIVGNPVEQIPQIIKQYNLDAVFVNRSYGQGSQTRDRIISERCHQHDIAYCDYADFLLVEPDRIPQRKVYTPFYHLWQQELDQYSLSQGLSVETINLVQPIDPRQWDRVVDDIGPLASDYESIWPVNFAHERLNQFDFEAYDNTRNTPSIDGSSRLSPYIRFGIISIRTLYHHVKNLNKTYVKELARREFWQHIMYYFPFTRDKEFQEKRQNLIRDNDYQLFEAWKEGMTGYPLIDAGMRQLKAQNRIHNRVRMVVASFLTKDLMIDRRWGEKHFADYLLDYDANVNIGNRQRSASVGADPKPLRIFSPMLQSERFDTECQYIKRWVPELRDIPSAMIHNPLKYPLGYAKPIVDHALRSKLAKDMYMKKNQFGG